MSRLARLGNAVAAAGIAIVLLVAFGLQFGLKELPCPLCNMQRVAFALCGFGLRRKRVTITLRRTLLLAPLALSLLALFGCGGGWRGPSTTPPGSFVVTITGTSGTLTASTTVTVVVQ